MQKTAIVIPTYNEKENIAELIQRIFSQKIENLFIIFVDDSSPDNTAKIINTAKQSYSEIFLIQRPKKSGLGSAYIEGFKKALSLKADYIFEMDADLSHAPEDIPRLLLACQNGADLAIGSRRVEGGKIIGWNCKRHLFSRGAMFCSRLILRLKAKDVTSGFRCYRAFVLKQINLDAIKSNGYAFQEEMLFRVQKNQNNIVEVPVIFEDRKKGLSKLSSKDILEFFKLMIKLR